MRFTITRHSGYVPPADAMELLLRHLGDRRNEVSFALSGAQIIATSEDDEGDAEVREGQIALGRRAVFDIVDEVCESAPELESDWYAVSYMG